MPRDYKVYLEDIRGASRKIRDFTKGISLQDFTADERNFDAVVRNLEIVAEEAIKQIPEDVCSALLSDSPSPERRFAMISPPSGCKGVSTGIKGSHFHRFGGSQEPRDLPPTHTMA
jgi:Protein of unknown function DUF86